MKEKTMNDFYFEFIKEGIESRAEIEDTELTEEQIDHMANLIFQDDHFYDELFEVVDNYYYEYEEAVLEEPSEERE